MDTFSTAWLSDPTVFSVGRMKACSDHDFFASMEEADIVRQFRHASLVELPGAGHGFSPQDFQTSLVHIRRFLTGEKQ